MSLVEQIKSMIVDIENKDDLAKIIGTAMCQMCVKLHADETMGTEFRVVGEVDTNWAKLHIMPEVYDNTGVRYSDTYYICEGID